MTAPPSQADPDRPSPRLLVVDASIPGLAGRLENLADDLPVRIERVETLAEAITRVQQRTSKGLGYAGVVVGSTSIANNLGAFERLTAANLEDGWTLVVGEPPDELDIERPALHALQAPPDDPTGNQRLAFLLRTLQSHGDKLHYRARLREAERENEQLRNRLGLAEKRVQHLNRVFHHSRDPVTGVANREFLFESLDIELAHQERVVRYEFAFGILEIDDFEHHLERLGREHLDKALVQMTSRIIDTLRTSDRVGRLDQDQFGIIVGDSPSGADVRATTTRLLDALSSPIEVQGEQLDFSYSIGVTLSGPQHVNPDHIVQDANLAVAESRTERGTAHTIYEQDYSGDGIDDTALAREMARELQSPGDNGFYLKFQPIFDLKDDTIAGFEALCRWDHSERGEIEPNKFIAIAEYTNLIQELGVWTLDEAGRRLESWRRHDDIDDLPFLTVNLSKEQMRSEDFADLVIETLKPYDLELDRLVVELRETATIEQHDVAITNLGQLKSFGVRVAVDDFGVAESSFASLYRLPVDLLKIDRTLVSSLADGGGPGRAIVGRLVELCDDMDLVAIAEGVETPEEHGAIVELGCEFAQGYHYSEAQPAEEARRRLTPTPDDLSEECRTDKTPNR